MLLPELEPSLKCRIASFDGRTLYAGLSQVLLKVQKVLELGIIVSSLLHLGCNCSEEIG
jgi:hypothetical protein